MANYELKAELLQNGTFNDFRKINNLLRTQKIDIDTYADYLTHLGNENYKECLRLYGATKSRTTRLKNRINRMLESGQCKFLTLTFNDNAFINTSEETRRRYVARWLKENTILYVANVDYGKTTEREHYHAVALVNKRIEKTWSHGYMDIKSCYTKNQSTIRLAKYVAKLTNHAIKNTTKQNKILYSRKLLKEN